MKARILFVLAAPLLGQPWEYRGFLQTSAQVFPYARPGDSSHVIGEGLLRAEARYRPAGWLSIEAGFDARSDTHHQVSRTPGVTWWDRGFQRPALSVRLMNVTLRHGPFTAQLGKQIIRWGAADVVNPTDRFAPRDYLTVVENEVLPVTAARASYEAGGTRIEFVAAPRLTPSRAPLARQRWAPRPAEFPDSGDVRQPDPAYPNRAQWGVRWSRSLARLDYSLCFFDGNNHAPLGDGALLSVEPWVLEVTRSFPRIRMYGGDLVWPARFVTVRAESAYFAAKEEVPGRGRADDYLIYLIQAERQAGEVHWAAAYTRRAILEDRKSLFFDPMRSLSGSFLGRLGWALNSKVSVGLEGAVRQAGTAWLMRAGLTRSWGRHWTTRLDLVWIYGAPNDFLGQFRRNSYSSMSSRYSF